jgi:hypothetical protein
VCNVLNRVLTKNKEIIPFEEWEKKKLNLSYMCTWGCLAKVNVPINKKHKLEPKTVDCVFLGYAIHIIGYMFLIINSEIPNMHVGTIMKSRDTTFFENEFLMKTTPSTTGHESIIPHEHKHEHEHEHETFTPVQQIGEPHEQNPKEDDIVVTRKSKRQRIAKSFENNYIMYLVDDTPMTIEHAYSSPNGDLWKEVVKSEMDSIMSNGTWEVVDRPYGCKPIGCK